MEPSKLESDKYYYCKTINDSYGFMWISLGKHGRIHLGQKGNPKPEGHTYQEHGFCTLSNDSEWEVRDATQEEIDWVFACEKAGMLVRKPFSEINQSYQIY